MKRSGSWRFGMRRDLAPDIRGVNLPALPRFYCEDPNAWEFLATMIDSDHVEPDYAHALLVAVDARLSREPPYTIERYSYAAPAEMLACVLADRPCSIVLPARIDPEVARGRTLPISVPSRPALVVYGLDPIAALRARGATRLLHSLGCATRRAQWVRTDERPLTQDAVNAERPFRLNDALVGVCGEYRVIATRRALITLVTEHLMSAQLRELIEILETQPLRVGANANDREV